MVKLKRGDLFEYNGCLLCFSSYGYGVARTTVVRYGLSYNPNFKEYYISLYELEVRPPQLVLKSTIPKLELVLAGVDVE